MAQNSIEVNPYYTRQTLGKTVSLLKSKLSSLAVQMDIQAITDTPEIRAV